MRVNGATDTVVIHSAMMNVQPVRIYCQDKIKCMLRVSRCGWSSDESSVSLATTEIKKILKQWLRLKNKFMQVQDELKFWPILQNNLRAGEQHRLCIYVQMQN